MTEPKKEAQAILARAMEDVRPDREALIEASVSLLKELKGIADDEDYSAKLDHYDLSLAVPETAGGVQLRFDPNLVRLSVKNSSDTQYTPVPPLKYDPVLKRVMIGKKGDGSDCDGLVWLATEIAKRIKK